MKIDANTFVIHQPKYTVPCVFDLNDRGTFPERPSVTGSWGFRVLADSNLQSRIQFARLIHRPGKDSQSGKPYDWMVEEVLLDLDEQLMPDTEAVAGKIVDAEIQTALMDEFNEWRGSFVPMKDGNVDLDALRQKITDAVGDRKARIRENLVRRNRKWVLSSIPRRIHNFKYGLYNHVKEKLYPEYQRSGGEDSEQNLIKKIALFNQVLENCDRADRMKPDGNQWRNEDEIWQCWIGFAGSEAEALRICRTMDAVFRDLQL